MKKLLYLIIYVLILSVLVAGSKPCCNKKVEEGVVNCKLNKTIIQDRDSSSISEFPLCNKQTCYKNSSKNNWWKFWKLNRNSKTCACNELNQTASDTGEHK